MSFDSGSQVNQYVTTQFLICAVRFYWKPSFICAPQLCIEHLGLFLKHYYCYYFCYYYRCYCYYYYSLNRNSKCSFCFPMQGDNQWRERERIVRTEVSVLSVLYCITAYCTSGYALVHLVHNENTLRLWIIVRP